MAFRLPAEWEPHEAVWIAWPHQETDFPGKLRTVEYVYVEILRLLHGSERVEVLVQDKEQLLSITALLNDARVPLEGIRFHQHSSDRSWLRDSAPTAVLVPSGKVNWISWNFNAWAKYDNYSLDATVPTFISNVTSLPLIQAKLPVSGEPFVLEGGVFDTDGAGTLMVTEECLLSDVQVRNPGLSRSDYEQLFAEYLGCTRTIWLEGGCVGDDTHGHIDDIARFAPDATVLLAYEDNPQDENYKVSQKNLQILENSRNASGEELNILKLPFPQARYSDGMRLPASYANFYISNTRVLVPVFNDVNDSFALQQIAGAYPNHEVLGVYCGDLVLGQGTLHCLSQQQIMGKS